MEKIIENTRNDNHREPLLRFSDKSRKDLVERIIPFFEERPLRTAKAANFQKFVVVISAMQRREHLTYEGLVRIAKVTETMNRRQPSRYLKSSEAIRQPASPPTVS